MGEKYLFHYFLLLYTIAMGVSYLISEPSSYYFWHVGLLSIIFSIRLFLFNVENNMARNFLTILSISLIIIPFMAVSLVTHFSEMNFIHFLMLIMNACIIFCLMRDRFIGYFKTNK